ncbi:MAG: GNAT family N-acyltransferase [Pseudomonadota bacterium]
MDKTTASQSGPYLDTAKVLGLPADAKPNALLMGLVERLTGVSHINAIMEDIGRPWPEAGPLIDDLFERLNIQWDIENPEMLEGLDDRPKIFVANHPYGLPDAFALFKVLTRYRKDIRIFANKLLAATQLEEPRLLFVDPFVAPGSQGQNRKSIATALKHLRNGGDLALFPGRICSHLKTSDWTISDSEWTDQVRNFVDICDGEMVPLYISGRNSMLFNLSGLIHPRIRTYMLLREFLRGGHNFTFRVGEPVSASQLKRVSRSMPAGGFARSMVYALKTGSAKVHDLPHLIEPELRSPVETLAVERQGVATGGAEVEALLERHEMLVSQNGFRIYNMEPGLSHEALDIICEIRFQAYAAETTVSDPRELTDSFDAFYNHLVLWDENKKTVAGVYRYVLPDPATRKAAPENLVTSSIFNLSAEFEKLLPNSMELGRAAILPEYQKTYSPLMLLWRAILEVPRKNKAVRYLFGPVTMGQKYSPVSRELLRRFIMKHCGDKAMEGFVSPRNDLDFRIPKEVDLKRLEEACGNFSQLGNIVTGLEGGKRMLPVLFRHYANVGCRYIGFGEWKELDNATTGLTILDLHNISPSLIQRYFGEDGAKAFLAGR